jgi:hypothetical protein
VAPVSPFITPVLAVSDELSACRGCNSSTGEGVVHHVHVSVDGKCPREGDLTPHLPHHCVTCSFSPNRVSGVSKCDHLFQHSETWLCLLIACLLALECRRSQHVERRLWYCPQLQLPGAPAGDGYGRRGGHQWNLQRHSRQRRGRCGFVTRGSEGGRHDPPQRRVLGWWQLGRNFQQTPKHPRLRPCCQSRARGPRTWAHV